jgi:hypothetical protein
VVGEVRAAAGLFFVAGEHDGEGEGGEVASGVEGAEGGEEDDDAAFHVGDAGAGGAGAFALELLEGAGGFKDGIEVTDEEDGFTAVALVFGDEVGAAIDGVHGEEARGEAESVELCTGEFGHGADAGVVEGAGVLVDEGFEQGEGGGGLAVDGGEDGGLLGDQREGEGEGEEQGKDGKSHLLRVAETA